MARLREIINVKINQNFSTLLDSVHQNSNHGQQSRERAHVLLCSLEKLKKNREFLFGVLAP